MNIVQKRSSKQNSNTRTIKINKTKKKLKKFSRHVSPGLAAAPMTSMYTCIQM